MRKDVIVKLNPEGHKGGGVSEPTRAGSGIVHVENSYCVRETLIIIE
jgi:hypothetical protein